MKKGIIIFLALLIISIIIVNIDDDGSSSTVSYGQSIENSYSTISKQKRFETFISLLSSYSGKNIQDYFSQTEWNTIINKTNS